MGFAQRNRLAEIMKAKREESQRIKKEFVETGQADFIIEEVKRKSKPEIDIESLPF